MPGLFIIPSVDIKDGKTVRVVQGIPELHVPSYGNDPIEMSGIWRIENARMLHFVDYDAIHGDKKNLPLIQEICETYVTPIQYAGGIKTPADAEMLFKIGVHRVVVSKVAVYSPETLKEMLETFGTHRITVAIDVFEGRVLLRTTMTKTELDPLEFSKQLSGMGVVRLIVNDMKRNGTLSGPNLELPKAIALTSGCKVTLAGGLRNRDELMDVQELTQYGVDSVIIGRALYENRFPCQKLWRIVETE